MQQPRRQRQLLTSKSQTQTAPVDTRFQESNSGQAQGQKNQYIIEMIKDYPFNQPCPNNCLKLVKHTRQFRSAEYPDLKRRIQANLQLKHPNLISIVRAFQSKKNSFFELYYEYVPDDIESVLSSLDKHQISEAQSRLSDICKYLIINNIIPEVSSSRIGFKDRTLKYFLNIDKITSKSLKDKKQISTIKQIEIRSFFSSQIHKYTSPPNKLTRHSSNTTPVNSSSASFLVIDSEPRNSSLINRKPAQLSSERNLLDINKIRLIDDKIKQIRLNMEKKSKPFRQSTGSKGRESAYIKKPSHSPSAPNKDMVKMVNEYMQAHQYQLKRGRDQMESPAQELAVGADDDQDSIDTYNQQLGLEPELPKIVLQQMRQTTKPTMKSPQQMLFKEKLHESVGNTHFNFIKKALVTKDTQTLRELELPQPENRGRQVSYQEPQKSAGSGYFGNRKYQKSEVKKSPEGSIGKSAAASKGSNQSRKRISDHINEIRTIQKEMSIRKLSENREENKRPTSRKMTEPKGRGLHDQKIQDIMKYYSFEPGLMDEFNDIFQSEVPGKPTQSRINTEYGAESQIREINERVKLALKKSEATLESIRQKRGWKLQVNVSGSLF